MTLIRSGGRAFVRRGRGQSTLRAAAVAALLLFLAASGTAQTAAPAEPPPPGAAPIADNSFLIEEAYNQEHGVVQHINTFSRQRGGKWSYTLTQEWPAPSQRHQLSFTLPVDHAMSPGGSRTGIGDAALNYRWQALGMGETRVALSPRLTLLVSTGSHERGHGSGGVGLQFNLPLSVRLTDHLVTHWNAGTTYTPSARNVSGEEARARAVNLGQSVVWLAHPRFNVLLETSWGWSEEVAGPGLARGSTELFLNPGIRWAHNFKSGLQIVPGLAFPIGVGPSKGESAVFLYLSFEHPFRKQAR